MCCEWGDPISPNKAMVILSFRYLSDDHFWFTFFHEIAHLLLHNASLTLRGRLLGHFGIINGPAAADQCIDLDGQPAEEQAPRPALPPGFTETIGEPRQLLIDAGRV
jgi:hypothetical protein